MATTVNQIHLNLSFNQLFELVKQLPAEQKKKLAKVLAKDNAQFDEIPEEHKTLVRSRIKKSKIEKLLNWDDIKNDFDGI